MRMYIVVVVVIVVGALGFMSRTVLFPGLSGSRASVDEPIEASTTLWPLEIHTHYKGMKGLPVHDVKGEAF
jgi:hypothetical protein